ncbi:MAG TPA: hypothetical protein VKJ07_13190, partial [Mycobacteriales bacterium]|nr:hypothetical protein [Mycobacteriales bacterium]
MVTATKLKDDLVGSAPASAAGPIEMADLARLSTPPALRLPRIAQVAWVGLAQWSFMFRNQRKFGEVWTAHGYVRGRPVVTHHPDHVRSLFTAPS